MLLDQALSLANQATEELMACELPVSLIEPLKELQGEIANTKFHAKASAYIAKSGRKHKVDAAFKARPLLNRLDDFDAGGNSGDYQLFSVPPMMEFVPCKPAFFDISLNHVGAIPDLQKCLDAHQSKSGGFLGWLRRG